MWFGKWLAEYSKIFTRALESLKIGILMRSFNPKLKKYEYKIQRGVISHDNEEWRKTLRGIDLSRGSEFEWILIRALESLKNFHFSTLLLSKYMLFELKKVLRSYLSWHWRGIQNLNKNSLVAWKMTWGIWQFGNFHHSTRKCQNWNFDGILLSKVENVWA